MGYLNFSETISSAFSGSLRALLSPLLARDLRLLLETEPETNNINILKVFSHFEYFALKAES